MIQVRNKIGGSSILKVSKLEKNSFNERSFFLITHEPSKFWVRVG